MFVVETDKSNVEVEAEADGTPVRVVEAGGRCPSRRSWGGSEPGEPDAGVDGATSMRDYTMEELVRWCGVPVDRLEAHPERKVPLRLCRDSAEMGRLMALELVEEIERNERDGRGTRAIVPCGPMAWYQPFTTMVSERR